MALVPTVYSMCARATGATVLLSREIIQPPVKKTSLLRSNSRPYLEMIAF